MESICKLEIEELIEGRIDSCEASKDLSEEDKNLIINELEELIEDIWEM